MSDNKFLMNDRVTFFINGKQIPSGTIVGVPCGPWKDWDHHYEIMGDDHIMYKNIQETDITLLKEP